MDAYRLLVKRLCAGTPTTAAVVCLALALTVIPAQGQTSASRAVFIGRVESVPTLGGVPQGEPSPQPIPLTLPDAVARALRANLGLLLSQERVHESESQRSLARSELLPNVVGRVSEVRQEVNLAAFGFTGAGFNFGPIVGPFNVFDARIAVTQSVFDRSRLLGFRASDAGLRAEQETGKDTRELVTMAIASLYVQAASARDRIASTHEQVTTAETLYKLAVDLRAAGVVAGLDVTRAEVQLKAQQSREVSAQSDFEKLKLQLGRAIGLPIGQSFDIVDPVPHRTQPAPTLEAAMTQATSSRADFRAAQLRMQQAEAEEEAARSERIPAVGVNADYGAIGASAGSAQSTFSVAAAVRVPVFEGGRQQAHVVRAQAQLAERRAEWADYKGRLDYEVRAALLDLRTAEQQLALADAGVDLATRELQLARDRFSAGVASNIEVVRAQDAIAVATEQQLASVTAYNVARVALAGALGIAETSVPTFTENPRP